MRRALCALALLSLACQAGRDTSGFLGMPIVNGIVDTDPNHDAVVALTDNSGFAFCTGTFIGQQTIVSAGHCFFDPFDPSPIPTPIPPNFIYFGTFNQDDAIACGNNPNSATCDRFIPVTEFAVHPQFNFDTIENDIAVVRIAFDPAGVAPKPILAASDGTGFAQADEGQAIDFVGFGITEDDLAGGTSEVIRRQVGGTLGAVGPDGGVGIDGNQVFYSQPLAVGGPCFGDSGGPLFILRNNAQHLGAVTSFGDEACADFGVSTRVDVFADNFIRPFQNGEPIPGVEDCDNGADDDGDGQADCADQDCVNSLSCRGNGFENCLNNLDDDADGVADCDDNDCAGAKACKRGIFSCAVEAPQAPHASAAPLLMLAALLGLALVISRRK
jgi:hypothetical protein